MIGVYLKYFFYIIQHKYYVGIECLKMRMFVHAVTHDLSKFLPSEFFPYARNFFAAKQYLFGKKPLVKNIKEEFDTAWLLHQHRNKHHWDYWVNSMMKVQPMPKKYVKQMVADWRGMGRKFNDTAEEYYKKNKFKMNLHPNTEKEINKILYGFYAQNNKLGERKKDGR